MTPNQRPLQAPLDGAKLRAASCDGAPATMVLDVNGYEVADGDMVQLVRTWGTKRAHNMFGMWRIQAPEFLLTLTTTGPDGEWTAVPDF